MHPTAEERRLKAQVNAHKSWAQTPDRAARTAAARKALLAKFETQVDPNNELPPAERAIRAEHARKAFYAEMAYKSARARRKAKEAIAAAEAADAALAEAGDVA